MKREALKTIKPEISSEDILMLSQKVVRRYVSKGSIPKREEEDIAMWVVEKFLLKKDTIINKFQGNSKFSTYCFAVLNRMCLEVIRKEIKHWNLSENQHDNHGSPDAISSIDLLLIKEELKLLHKIISLFSVEKHKIRLFFAYYFRLHILQIDVKNYDVNYLEHLLDEVFLVKENLSKGDVFAKLSAVLKIVESKAVKADAVRMWLNKNRLSMINRLNLSTGKSNYDIDSFQALYEYYYVEGDFVDDRTSMPSKENQYKQEKVFVEQS